MLINRIVTTNLESGVTVTYSTNESSIMSQQQHGTGAAAENRLLDATTVPEQEHLRVVRRQCKGAVTRFLGILEWAIIERNEAKVQDGLVQLKECFSRFETAHDNYHDTLDTEESIDTSELWFRDVALNYMEGIQSAMDFLARCSQPPNDNAISTDISISEASASSATAPAGDIVTDKLMTLLNIPRAELDVFNGDPSEYHTVTPWTLGLIALPTDSPGGGFDYDRINVFFMM